MVSLQSIPPELLGNICIFLDTDAKEKEKKNDIAVNEVAVACLSCKTLAAAAEPYLKPEIHVTNTRRGIDRFEDVARKKKSANSSRSSSSTAHDLIPPRPLTTD